MCNGNLQCRPNDLVFTLAYVIGKHSRVQVQGHLRTSFFCCGVKFKVCEMCTCPHTLLRFPSLVEAEMVQLCSGVGAV